VTGGPENPLAVLTAEERERLTGAVPLALGFIAQCDGRVSFFEKFAAARQLMNLPAALGMEPGLLAAAMDPAATQKRLLEKMRQAVEEELSAAAAAAERLPEETRARFHAYLREACMKVAAASSGISDEEKRAVRRVLTVMGVPLTPEVMEKLVIRE
jgi:tellurite resistance protein